MKKYYKSKHENLFIPEILYDGKGSSVYQVYRVDEESITYKFNVRLYGKRNNVKYYVK